MIRRTTVFVLKCPLHLYRYAISPMIASNCRFQPTCSAYAIEALEKHGPFRGVGLAFRRVMRCRPGGKSGFDPVPSAKDL